jgi:hypothetical protein
MYFLFVTPLFHSYVIWTANAQNNTYKHNYVICHNRKKEGEQRYAGVKLLCIIKIKLALGTGV